MVFYSDWPTFEKAATSIYKASARKARYTIKYRNCDAMLVLKVTDDCTCAQMRTERMDDVRKISQLHRLLTEITSNRSEPVKKLAPIFPSSSQADTSVVSKEKKTNQQQSSNKRRRGNKKKA